MHNFFLKSCNKCKYPKNILTYLLEKYPDKDWWFVQQWGISSNPNITLEFIEKYPDKPWNWYSISSNPSITLEIIEYFKNKINFNELSNNTFKYHNKKVKIISEKIKLYHYLSFSKIIYDIKRFWSQLFRKKLFYKKKLNKNISQIISFIYLICQIKH